jgi:hypothetical protein
MQPGIEQNKVPSQDESQPTGFYKPEPYTDELREDDIDNESSLNSGPNPDDELVRWSATEYIHHDKNPLWFVIFAIVVIVFIIVAIFVIKSLTFAILIPVMAAALLVYVYRPPRVINYTLSRHGLHANDHLYPFADFKGFAVVHGEEEYSVMLIPTKRFRPGISVYFPEDAGEEIVDVLATRLPMEEFHIDLVDQIIHKLRI